jgi:hypothetical protein
MLYHRRKAAGFEARTMPFRGGGEMSIYRVHFNWKGKSVELTARDLDLTHPYFVSIKNLVFKDTKRLVIDPAEDELRKEFGTSTHLMIPFQTVSLIEEIEEPEPDKPKVREFTLIEPDAPEGKPDDESGTNDD